MRNLIQEKRDSLELFIREQMIGPNGCRGRFSLEMEDGNPFDGEIINTTPGSIYSTAVLFPRKAVGLFDDRETSDNPDAEEDEDVSTNGEEEDEQLRSDSNEQNGARGNDVDDEDVYSLSRRFPNTVGISCCLIPEADITKDIKISVSGRYYTKIVRGDKQRVQVLIKENLKEFEQFFTEHPILHQYFDYASGKLRIKAIPSKDVTKIREMLRSINMDCASQVAMIEGNTDPIFLKIQEGYRFLLSYREVLFNKWLNRIHFEEDGQGNEIASYLDEEEKKQIENQLKKVEVYETIMSYFDSLTELYDYKGFGFWQSHDFNTTIDLTGLERDNVFSAKKIYKPSDHECLNHFFSVQVTDKVDLALSAWLQITRNSKDKTDKNLYLKVLVVNDATPFRETNKNYFSIVNEEVNKLCFFGIKIDLESDALISYHADNTYNDVSKDEDKLNFLYRSIQDYGVGHLCSVDWEKNAEGKVNHIWSEFIPSFETPDIEPVPRKKYVDYI